MMLYRNTRTDRRGVFKILTSLALPVLVRKTATARDSAQIPEEVAPGILVHQGVHGIIEKSNGGDIANLSAIIGNDAVAIVDTGSCARLGATFRNSVRAFTDKPIRFVINTHMHPDHVLGNAAFESDDVEFVAHHKLQRGLAARADIYLRRARDVLGDELFAGTKIVMPTKPITETTTLDLGNRKLVLQPRTTAHTDNDLTIFDEHTQTLFAGDLLFSGHIPTLDGSILGWLRLIETLKTETAARVVPGHGTTSLPWPSSILPEQRYLQTIVDDVRSAIKAGKTISEATTTAGLTERGKWDVFDEHHVRNVTAAFAELEWE